MYLHCAVVDVRPAPCLPRPHALANGCVLVCPRFWTQLCEKVVSAVLQHRGPPTHVSHQLVGATERVDEIIAQLDVGDNLGTKVRLRLAMQHSA